ncbi:MAG: hypothetical protein NZ551_11390 [Microscillaceae bacterium]|nr:hypothetical protein [Microscillaceae bacterium]MDW8461798.1 hypothetical protein [Cytophagales bacterium]
MKSQKIKLSRIYINEYGEIVKHQSKITKIALHFCKILKVLPFIVSITLCALMIMEVCCFIGLVQSLMNLRQSGDTSVYLFLCVAIFLICLISLSIGDYLVKIEQPKAIEPKLSKLQKKLKNNSFDHLSY